MSSPLEGVALSYLRTSLNDQTGWFRPGQWEAIEALVEGKARLLVVQRTGWGKSVVYFLTTRLLRDMGVGPTLLISPLLSLMRNQIEAAERVGVRAVTINSSNKDEWENAKAQIKRDEVDILLISPERLSNDDFRNDVLSVVADRVGLFVVDEAHCISDWGHDFRPDYKRITRVLQAMPANVPVLTTTATANDRVINDIVEQLGPDLTVIRGQLGRESLRLQTIDLPDQAARMAWLSESLPKMPGSGIVYTLTIRDAERVAGWLKWRGINAEAYSGQTDPDTRIELEQRLLNNDVKALVATSALGMGFDKPDLGFVVHFQRPGSVIHYYQQIGRAGRALDDAFVVLLSGVEDQDIVDYFIRTAFPPEGHAEAILGAMALADDGVSLPQLEGMVNLSRTGIEKTLKLLAAESPSPVFKQGSRWYATAVPYAPDHQKIQRLTNLRRFEQEQMDAYARDEACLMAFLQHALGDSSATACGRCEVCLGSPILRETYPRGEALTAIAYLRKNSPIIEPRKMWPSTALNSLGWRGRIHERLMAEPGRALSVWGDAGWGATVKENKFTDEYFDDSLVAASAELIWNNWKPEPAPRWVTCVPSPARPELVPGFAARLARELELPFCPVVVKTRTTLPQKEMENSYQQASNIVGAFEIEPWPGMMAPVLLVDDLVDSRWTFTIIAALLRSAGSGPVYPFALAMSTRG